MAFELPNLPYAHDALASKHMSQETLELHHGKHHNGYVTTLNSLTEGTPLADKPLEDVVKETFGKPDQKKIFNQAGQHWNHVLFWQAISPKGGGDALPGKLEAKIREDFGSLDAFKEAFKQAGATHFGSGWAWLVLKDGKLTVYSTPNAENPLAHGDHALLGCDVWEHSYYLDFRNRKPDYVQNFLDNLVNWEFVESRLMQA
jgi:Fe-Mn family superoxide dismutase